MITCGDFCFIGYCAGNPGGSIDEQINTAFDTMERRLAEAGLCLEDVVKMDCLFSNIWDIPAMEAIIRKRFNGKYPVRKSFETRFADSRGLLFQADAIAYRKTPHNDRCP